MSEPGDARAVLVTGGAGGMGSAIARRFLEQEDDVVLTDLDRVTLEQIAEELDVEAVVGDVSDVAQCGRIVDEAAETLGRLDVLVNCAGVWVEGPSAEVTEPEWDRTIDVNLKGTFFMCRSAIPHLLATGGCIVNLSSDYGLVGGPGAAIYNASKFGVNGITKSLALELAPDGVRVNSVCPADVDTPMLAGQARDYGSGDEAGYLEELLATLPQGERARFIRPEEVAALVCFLASDEAAPITGACIPIEWGITAGY